MLAKAKVNHVRIAPRKVKIVVDLIRKKNVSIASAILENVQKAASPILLKLLKSAVANAENNHSMNSGSLYISEIYANSGPILKRMQPRAKGRGARINKRTSHITIVLKEKIDNDKNG
ncbi:MAG: 50S ribosomal protein L22 [Clostridiales bacterium]|nr:50S ribosomal protein L22 [Clostridiales bacterium]